MLVVASLLAWYLLPGGGTYEADLHPWPGPSSASAATTSTYYISTTGDDRQDGAVRRPWATIQHADQVVLPGDTVVVLDGLYYGDVVLKKSGTPGHPITYTAQHKWGAKLRGMSSRDGSAVIRLTGGRIIVKYFDITGKNANGIILASSGSSASFNQAIGNYVHDITTPCDDDSGSAIETGGGDNYRGISHNDMIGNLVVNILPDGGCPGGHPATGIYAEIPYSVITDNIVVNAGYGIQSWHAASHVTIVGNTLINNLRPITRGAGDAPGGRTNDNSVVSNNVIYNSKETAIAETGATGLHNRYTDNLIFGGDTRISLNNDLHAIGTVYADPHFIKNTGTAYGDYRLSPDSPAKAAGVALPVSEKDFVGAPRPRFGLTDLGACLSQPNGASPCPEAQTFKVAAGATAQPAAISHGQSSVISWTTQDAASATLNGLTVPLNGSVTVHPSVTTIYKIVAVSPAGQKDWGSATVTVH